MRRVLLLAGLLLGLLAIPASAQATVRLNGCDLAAYKPIFSYAYSGLFYVRYSVSAYCYQPHDVDLEYQIQGQYGPNWTPVTGSSRGTGGWYISNSTIDWDTTFCCVPGDREFRTYIYRASVDGATAAVAIDSLGWASNPSWP